MDMHPFMPPPPHGAAGGHPHRAERFERERRTDRDLTATNWLTEENTSFEQKNGFLYIKNGTDHCRAFLNRAFPQELLWEFISVLDEEQQEIGIIRNVDQLGEENRRLVVTELQRRYYSPVLLKIHSMKERYGFSYWKAETADGNVQFTLHDTYRSIVRAGGNRVLLTDVNGNRFEIPDVTALDKKSYRKIEFYL